MLRQYCTNSSRINFHSSWFLRKVQIVLHSAGRRCQTRLNGSVAWRCGFPRSVHLIVHVHSITTEILEIQVGLYEAKQWTKWIWPFVGKRMLNVFVQWTRIRKSAIDIIHPNSGLRIIRSNSNQNYMIIPTNGNVRTLTGPLLKHWDLLHRIANPNDPKTITGTFVLFAKRQTPYILLAKVWYSKIMVTRQRKGCFFGRRIVRELLHALYSTTKQSNYGICQRYSLRCLRALSRER